MGDRIGWYNTYIDLVIANKITEKTISQCHYEAGGRQEAILIKIVVIILMKIMVTK